MRYFLSGFLLVLSAAGGLFAQEEFAPAVPVLTGNAPLDVHCFRGAAPFLGDFDGDGLNDLLVGHDEPGQLRIYRNRGTSKVPKFNDYELFRVNKEIAVLPSNGEFHPQLVDLDGDGKPDLLSTTEEGFIFWYRRTADAEFADAEILKLADGHVLSAGMFAACHAVDWDGDGDTDLILSGRRGENVTEVVLVENTGSPQSLSLSSPKPMMVDELPLRTSQAFAYPFVVDWNRDGKQDLLLGLGNGSVLLYENSGQSPTPTLAQPRMLVSPPNRQPANPDNEEIQRGRGGGFCIADWDNDGTLDILLGDQQENRVEPELTDEAEQLEQARRESARILREYRRVRRLSQKLDEATQQKQQEFLNETRKKFADQLIEVRKKISQLETAMQPQWKTHGYVWLLRRAAPPKSN